MPEQKLATPKQLREKDEKFAVEPPRMTVLSDHPILREDDVALGLELDSFGLRARLGAVYDIIRHKNTRAPIAIAIYGDWGTGKSSAMRWLRDQLALWSKQSKEHRAGHMKVRTVWFDPWKYQKREDVWRGLIAEVIIHSIDIKNASLATVTNATKKFGLFLGRSFLNVLSSAKVKAGAAEIDLDVLKKIAEDYREAAHPEKAYLNEFETALKDWVGDSLKADERMVVFIDDLDRCLPDVTFEVLEALKLYLNIPKLIFVVGLDRRVVESYVKHHYRKDEVDDSKARHYLDKMFQVEVEIPPSQTQIEGYLDEQVKELNKACDNYWSNNLNDAWDGQHCNIIEGKIRSLAEHNPREIKRLLNSTLLRATAAARNDDLGGREPERFTQGAQVFLIQRILRRDVPDSATLMLENATLEFFEQWSRFVCDYPEFRVPKDANSVKKRETVSVPAWMASRRPASGRTRRSKAEREDLPRTEDEAGGDYDLLRDSQPRYRDRDEAYPLLQNNDLWDLMRIPFSASVAATATSESGLIAVMREITPELLRVGAAGVRKGLRPGGPLPEAHRTEATDVVRSMPRAVQSAIAASLEKPVDQLTAGDLLAVRTINLSNADISDVSPLAKLRNLQDLNLSQTQVSDISPLADLRYLQGLHLGGTPVSDLSPLANLQNLQRLHLYQTSVQSVLPLVDLQNLEQLYLTTTQVSDISPLASLRNLRTLFLANTNVKDLSPLINLRNLQELHLGRTQVNDVLPLADLQNLQGLNLTGTQVSDVSPLTNLQKLRILILIGTQVNGEQISHLKELRPDWDIHSSV